MTVPTTAGTTTVLAYIPSPPQGVWYLGPLPIRAYALCIIVGIVVAVWWGGRRWQARGGQEGEVLDVAIWAVPFGLVGGRLYHLATDWQTYFGDGPKTPMDALRIWDGGLGIWGAVLLGGVGAWIGARRHGIKLPPFADAIAPAILLAQAIGRLGNYFNQELYGRPTTVPWGLEIYERVDSTGRMDPSLISGVSTGRVAEVVHPTFLYELVWNVAVVILLVVIDRRFRIGHGRLFALYVAGYCVGRFVVELMRSDPATHVFGIRINLFTAAVIFACAALYFVIAPKGREQGLQIYRPARADELEALGYEGYVEPPRYDDEDDTDEDDTDAEDAGEEDESRPDDLDKEPDTRDAVKGPDDVADEPEAAPARVESATVAPVQSAEAWVLESESPAAEDPAAEDPAAEDPAAEDSVGEPEVDEAADESVVDGDSAEPAVEATADSDSDAPEAEAESGAETVPDADAESDPQDESAAEAAAAQDSPDNDVVDAHPDGDTDESVDDPDPTDSAIADDTDASEAVAPDPPDTPEGTDDQDDSDATAVDGDTVDPTTSKPTDQR